MKYDGYSTRNSAIIGAWMGAVLFAFFGLINGAAAGVSVGSRAAWALFGLAGQGTTPARLVTGASMFAGILTAGALMVVSSGALGWCAGWLVGRIYEPVKGMERTPCADAETD
jgi:hypothetical protein